MTMVEKLARAIYDATDPLSGDPIATLIHVSDHLFWDGVQPDKEMTDVERQMEAVQEVCRAAARAALSAMMDATPGMIAAHDAAHAEAETVFAHPRKVWQAMIRAALDEGEGG